MARVGLGDALRDLEYGQWGLELLSPADCASRTRAEHRSYFADIVFGFFYGDQELMVYAPSEDVQRRILVAVALDERHEWRSPDPSIRGFLTRYREARGEKYWEP